MCSVKKVFLEISQNSQVFSYEFCEISKNTFFYRTQHFDATITDSELCHSGVFIVYFEQSSHIVPLFLMLTLNK